MTHRFILVAVGELGPYGDYHEEYLPTRKMVMRRAALWRDDFPGCTLTLEDMLHGTEEDL